MWILAGQFVSIQFPYRYKESLYGRIPDPYITISISTWYGWRNLGFLVDSGADVSIVPKSIAELVGLDLRKARKHRTFGVEGKGLLVYEGALDIKIGTQQLKIPCLFSSQEKTPLLLGRSGLFNHFTIVFDNQYKKLVFRPF